MNDRRFPAGDERLRIAIPDDAAAALRAAAEARDLSLEEVLFRLIEAVVPHIDEFLGPPVQ